MATTVSAYSGTPLPKKLGLKEGGTMVLLNAPVRIDQLMTPMPLGAALVSKLAASNLHVVLFCKDLAALKKALPAAAKKCTPMAACGFHGQRKRRSFSLTSPKTAYARLHCRQALWT